MKLDNAFVIQIDFWTKEKKTLKEAHLKAKKLCIKFLYILIA